MSPAQFLRFLRHLDWVIVRQIVESVGQRRLTGLASEMAYNAMLGLFPAILTVLTAIGLFSALHPAVQNLATQFSSVAPEEVQNLIQQFVGEISRARNRGLFSISFVAALWTSSATLRAAMIAFDQIHQVPRSQIRPFWKARLIALGLTIGTGLFLLSASVLVFIIDHIVQDIAVQSGLLHSSLISLWRLLSLPVALGIVSIAFAFIYRYGPSRWTFGTPLMPGAVLAAVSWAVLSSLFRAYVTNFGQYNRAYGAIGAVIVLLLWLYISSLILLIGSQVNVTLKELIQQAKLDAASPCALESSHNTRRQSQQQQNPEQRTRKRP